MLAVVSIAMAAADSYGFQHYTSGIWNCGGSGRLNHEIALVAYT